MSKKSKKEKKNKNKSRVYKTRAYDLIIIQYIRIFLSHHVTFSDDTWKEKIRSGSFVSVCRTTTLIFLFFGVHRIFGFQTINQSINPTTAYECIQRSRWGMALVAITSIVNSATNQQPASRRTHVFCSYAACVAIMEKILSQTTKRTETKCNKRKNRITKREKHRRIKPSNTVQHRKKSPTTTTTTTITKPKSKLKTI